MSDNNDKLRRIVEEEARAILSEQMLQEGIWSKMKNFAAKTLGTWEKGGKIRGRKKRAEGAEQQYVQAMQKLQKVASKESKTLIDRLEGDFKEAGYPNQEDKYEFLEQTMEIGAFYESLKKAVEGKEMSAVVANELIEQLRIIVKKFLDYELADVYKHFSEDVDRDQDDLILEAIIREQQDEKEEGPIASDKKSAVVKGLKSNVLPAILAAVGGASLIGKLIVESEWFKELTTQVINRDLSYTDYQEQVVGSLSPESGEGVTQMLGRVLHGDPTHFAADTNPAQLFSDMRAAGIDPSELSQLSDDPAAFMDAWKTATESGADTLGKMFPMQSIDLSPQDIKDFASSKVGRTVGDFAQYASELSDADLNTVAARASELYGDIRPGAGTPNYTDRAIKTIISNASAQPATDMLGANAQLNALNLAMQEFAAGGAPTSVSAGPGALGLKLGKSAIIKALKPVTKKAGESVLKTTAAGKIGAMLGPFLAPLGISLVASAVGVKALRMKGLKSSRAQVLNDLLQTLDYLDTEGGDSQAKPGQDPTDPPEKPPVEPPVDFEVPVLVRFDDDDVKIYKLKANYLKKQGNRQRAEDALKALEKSAVMGRDLQESEAFTALFEQDNDLDDTDSFEREFGRGKRVKDLRSAIRSAGRRRRLKSGARTKPVFYYVFDRSIQNDLDAMARGAKFNHFVSRVLRKAIAAVKANGNKPLTPEQAFAAIARKGGGGTGMKGLSIKEAIEMLRKYNVVVGKAAKGSPDKKATKGKKRPAQRASVTETYSDAIREVRSKASEDMFNNLVEKLIK